MRETEDTLTAERDILRVNLAKNSVEPLKDEVIMERPIELYVNDEHYAFLSISPSETKELAVGHLLAEKVINDIEEIKSLEASDRRVLVYLTKKTDSLSEKLRLVPTECGSGERNTPAQPWMKEFKDAPSLRFSPQTVIAAAKAVNSLAVMFRRTGGTHSSALVDENGRLLVQSEDIGRHNAVDKVIGKAALKGLRFDRLMLATTGRLTSEMVIKAANIRIPLMVSMSAPTDRGIEIAEMAGLTLIGFARGRRFNIYTHPERVEEP